MAERTTPADVWAKIDSTAGPSECWPWKASTDADGYGLIYIVNHRWRVHRWVLTQKVGDLGPEEVTRHTCDNPPCCNPAHLIRGTHADNARDMTERGRRTSGDEHWTRRNPERLKRGEANPAAELDARAVLELRRRYAAGETQTALARLFGLSQGHVSNIVLRKKWAHLKE